MDIHLDRVAKQAVNRILDDYENRVKTGEVPQSVKDDIEKSLNEFIEDAPPSFEDVNLYRTEIRRLREDVRRLRKMLERAKQEIFRYRMIEQEETVSTLEDLVTGIVFKIEMDYGVKPTEDPPLKTEDQRCFGSNKALNFEIPPAGSSTCGDRGAGLAPSAR